MAGFHQLWKLDLNSRDLRPHAGNGRERIIDGPLQHAELAQPSGIVSDGETIYFADSETSSVRSASVSPMGSVTPSSARACSPSETLTASGTT